MLSSKSSSSSSLSSKKIISLKQSSSSSSSTTEYSKLSSSEKKQLFQDFTVKFNKKYSDDEEDSRYETFQQNLELIDARNKAEKSKGGNAVHGVTIFADATEDEIMTSKMGFKDATKKSIIKMAKEDSGDSTFKSNKGSKDTVDWSGVYTTGIKDQGYCGSCWAFSAVSQIESDSIRAGYLTTDDELSEQQLVSCDTYDAGCNGGNPYYAYYYVYKAGGVETNASYPYASWGADVPSCDSDSSKYVVTVNDFYYLSSENAMESHVYSTGPISVCVDATNWPTYEGGIVSDCGTEVNHCVQAVGLNTEENYWIIRNSWGTDWGENGYIYVKAGENTVKNHLTTTTTTTTTTTKLHNITLIIIISATSHIYLPMFLFPKYRRKNRKNRAARS